MAYDIILKYNQLCNMYNFFEEKKIEFQIEINTNLSFIISSLNDVCQSSFLVSSIQIPALLKFK
jgi:hypothetical protein